MMKDTSKLRPPHARTDSNAEFTELVIKHGKFVRNFIAKKSWDREDVDDIYQTTMLEAFRSYKNFRNDCHPRTWMCGVAMMVFRNHLRKKSKVKSQPLQTNEEGQLNILDKLECSPMDTPEVAYEFESLYSSVYGHVQDLPENIRNLFITVAYRGLDYEKAAKMYDIPIGTVRSRISRARSILRGKRHIKTGAVYNAYNAY